MRKFGTINGFGDNSDDFSTLSSSSLLKNSVDFDAGERKESGSMVSRINYSPLPGSSNRSCVAVGSKNLFQQTARAVDGSNTNLTFNTTGSDMIRIAAPNFASGTTNTPIDGPKPREVSNVVSSGPQAEAHDPTGLSAMMYVWGQFIDHDLDHTLPDGTNSIDITIRPGDPNFPAGSTIPLTRFNTDPATEMR